MIVDDEPVNRQVLLNQLSLQNYQVSAATDGIEALNLIRSGDQPFDLIILDVMMPRMSGYEVSRQIRKHYSPLELPIIMLTAKHQVADLVSGFEAGANDYLTKPFSQAELLARIETHLQLNDLRMLNASKDKFFSIVAHDLRAPFHPVLSYSELLTEIAAESASSEIREMSAKIYDSAKNVYNLLENLLQWSRLQRGQMPLVPIDLDIQNIIWQNIALLTSQAQEKEIQIHNLIPNEMFAHGDESMVNTVFT